MGQFELKEVDGLTDRWNSYKAIHTKVRAADTGGNWDDAVAMAVRNSGTDSGVDTFKAFDESSAAQLQSTSDTVSSELSNTRGGLPPIGWLGLPLGIVAALLVVWGMSQRLEEYR